jgi:RNase P subunit RPR2
MGIFDFLKPKNKQEDREIGAIFSLFDVMIGLGENETKIEIGMLFEASSQVLKAYGVDVNNQEKYIQISNNMSKNQVFEILAKIDSDKVIRIIFPKLITLVTADGTVNPKRLDFLDMIGQIFVESGKMPKELLESFFEKLNKKNNKDSKKKSLDKSIENVNKIDYNVVADIHLFLKMGNIGYLDSNKKKFKEIFSKKLAEMFLAVHNENDKVEEIKNKYLSLAKKISKNKLINILNKYNRKRSDRLFILLIGLIGIGEYVTKDSVAILQFVAKHTNLSNIHLEKVKEASKIDF